MEKNKTDRNIILYRLTIAILLFWIFGSDGYLFFNSRKELKFVQKQQTEVVKTTDVHNEVQKNFDDALVRLDSLTAINNRLRQKLSASNSEIAKRKTEIRSVLNKKNATAPELSKAKQLINDLNSKITDNEQQVSDLKKKNKKLLNALKITTDSKKVTQETIIGESGSDPSIEVNSIRIPVYYATDRKVTGQKDAEKYYGHDEDLSQPLKYGRIQVSIPIKKHVPGEVDSRSLLNFVSDRRDTSKYFVITHIELMNYERFYNQLNIAVQGSGDRDLFVFIHGFSNTFTDAAFRTAQLAYDIGFKGAAVMYSWPSAGSPDGYIADAEKIKTTVSHLTVFLSDLVHKTGAKKINLIAHSIGNQALVDVLRKIDLGDGVKFNEIIMAAPDVDALYFKTEFASPILARCNRLTIYTSSKDWALRTSFHFHKGVPRLGEGAPNLFVYDGINTIDASNLECKDFFNHSYYAASRVVLDDIRDLLYFDADPSKRNLLNITDKYGQYWSFKK